MALSGVAKVGLGLLVALAAFGLWFVNRVAASETLSTTVGQPRDIELHDGEWYGISGRNGDFNLRSSTDLVDWAAIETPGDSVVAIESSDDRLRLGVLRSSDLLLFEWDPGVENWIEANGADPLISGDEYETDPVFLDVQLGDHGAAAVLSFPDSTEDERDRLLLIPDEGAPVEVPIENPWNGTISPHDDGFLINPFSTTTADEVTIVSFDGGETTQVAETPPGIVDIRALPGGQLLGLNTLNSGESASVVASDPPYLEWVVVAERPADDGCGSRFSASQDGELLLYYPYCDGHLWVAERGEEWVQTGDLGLGDADSNVEPIAIIDGRAILHTYEGVIAIDLPD